MVIYRTQTGSPNAVQGARPNPSPFRAPTSCILPSVGVQPHMPVPTRKQAQRSNVR